MQNKPNIYIFVSKTRNRKTTMIQDSISDTSFRMAKLSKNGRIPGIIFLVFFAITNIIHAAPENRQTQSSRVRTVVIDPGHGGHDPGAVYSNAREKDIVLDISLKLGNYIKAAFPDVKVIYTRDKDVFVPLHQRAAIANKNQADLFISVHVNAVSRGSAQGTETFILGMHRTSENLEVAKKENSVILLEADYKTTYEGFDPNSPESYIMFELVQDEYLELSAMLASAVQDQFRERVNRVDRSVKQAGFLVLRQVTMPGILVEAGFLSHPTERAFLMSETGRDYLASAIFRAFRDYKKKVEAKSSFLVVTEGGTQNVAARPTIMDHNPSENPVFFSVQVASLSKPVATDASNFKGEKDIFMKHHNKVYKYFSGRFVSADQAREEQKRLRKKFNGAFVVAFENNELIPVNKALQKL
jgi:N-acetylmuramoyl-L-alanine amidase